MATSVEVPVLVEDQGHPRGMMTVWPSHRRRGVHLVFGTLDQDTPVIQGNGHAAHLGILEGLDVLIDLGDLANGFDLAGIRASRRGSRRCRGCCTCSTRGCLVSCGIA